MSDKRVSLCVWNGHEGVHVKWRADMPKEKLTCDICGSPDAYHVVHEMYATPEIKRLCGNCTYGAGKFKEQLLKQALARVSVEVQAYLKREKDRTQ